jgi:hypothetical protein
MMASTGPGGRRPVGRAAVPPPADALIEAGWLAALGATAVLFNVHSYGTFDLDKVAVLRSVGLVMALAWMARGLASEPGARGRARVGAGAALVLAVLATELVATLLSIAPRTSLWGSYERAQGLYTTASYVLIGVSVAALVRTRAAAERLVSAVPLAALPVALYGIVQHFGTDPVSWGGANTQGRPSSTLGNPIFMAAFLAMSIPLTVGQLVEAYRALVAAEARSTRRVLEAGAVLGLLFAVATWWLGPAAGTLGAVTTLLVWTVEARVLGTPWRPSLRVGILQVGLSAQIASLLLSRSRGPWLGLAVGLTVFALVSPGDTRRRRAVAGVVAATLVAALALGVALTGVGPGWVAAGTESAVRALLARFEATTEVRLLIWDGAWQLVTADPWRALAGHGPDTMRLAYAPYNPPALGQLETRTLLPSRAHNEAFDILVTTGLLGLVVHASLWGVLLIRGLGVLGLVPTRAHRRALVGLWVLAGTGAVLVARLWDGWRLAGVALPGGLVLATVAYLVRQTTRAVPPPADAARPPDSWRLPVAGILAAVVAHLVEIQVGIAVTATRTLFWALAGLLLAAPRLAREPEGEQEAVPTPSQGSAPVEGLAAALVLATLLHDFLPFVHRGTGATVGWLLVFVWAWGALLLVTEPAHGPAAGGAGVARPLARYLLATTGGCVALVVLHLGVAALGGGPAVLTPAFVGLVLLAVLAGGGLSGRGPWRPRSRWPLPRLAPLALASVAAAGLLWTNLDAVRADVHFKSAWLGAERQSQPGQAVGPARRAVELAPGRDFYHLFLGRTLLEASRRQAPAEREILVREAEASLLHAHRLSPRNADHAASLAHLYRVWAQDTAEPALRARRHEKALAAHAEAARANPTSVLVWNAWAVTHLTAGDVVAAREKLLEAHRLDPTFGTTY